MVNVKEKDGTILLTVNGRRGPVHRSILLEDAEELLDDLEVAIETAKKSELPRGQVVRDAKRLVITEIKDFRTTPRLPVG